MKGGEGGFGVGVALREKSALDQSDGLLNGGEGGSGIVEAVFVELRELDVRGEAASAGFVDDTLPPLSGFLVAPEAAAGAGGAFDGLDTGGASGTGGEGGFGVLDDSFKVAGVSSRAAGLERELVEVAGSAEVSGKGDEGKDVPGVVAEDGEDMGGVAGAAKRK